MLTLRWLQRIALCPLCLAAVLFYLSREVPAQYDPSTHFYFQGGRLVDVRGDILQVRPFFQTALTRLVLSEETAIRLEVERCTLKQLRPGLWIYGMGHADPHAELTLDNYCELSKDPRPLQYRQRISASFVDYHQMRALFGKIKSVKPLIVVNEAGPLMATSS